MQQYQVDTEITSLRQAQSSMNQILREGPLAENQNDCRLSILPNENKKGATDLEFQLDSAPHTLQKPRGKQQEEGSPLPQQTQVETADTLRQNDFTSQLEVVEGEQSPHNVQYEISPQPLASATYDHHDLIASNINMHEQQTEADFAQVQSPQTSGSYLSPEGFIVHQSDLKPNKIHSAKSKASITKKDFIQENAARIKNIRENQLINSENRNKRAIEVASRNSQNPYGYKFFGMTEKGNRGQQGFQQNYRSQEWGKVLVMNNEIERKIKLNADKKNQITNFAFKKPLVPSTPQSRNSTKINFFSTKKEEAFHKTMQSSINMLSSFKTLELADSKAQELRLIPKSKDQVILAQNLNRNSRLDPTTYGRDVEIPSEYYSFQPKPEIIHNLNNSHVMKGRRNSYQSNLFQ